ncbi:MAG: MraY family glycosyltransferase [Bacteroidota bacterium]
MQSVLTLLGATVFSYLLNHILLKFSRNFGVGSRKSQNLVRWASTSKPTTGGISFYITFLVATIFLLITQPDLLTSANRFLALFLSATLAFLIGFADDAYGTEPALKFAGQVLCGVILIAFDIHIHFFDIWALDALLTVFWVVGIMNSVNMLDNMDAVTATIALSIIAVSLSMVIITEGINNLFFILVAIAGAFIGFLFLNWRPAKIYMGDTGSMFIGMVLAFTGILFFWNIETTPDNISYVRRLLIPVLVFIAPIMDTSFVTVARLARGSSPFVGGKDHLTHHLVHIGIPQSLVPVALGLVTVISGSLALFAFMMIPEWSPLYSFLMVIYPVCLVGFFVMLYLRGKRIGQIKDLLAERERIRSERSLSHQEAEVAMSMVTE